MTALRIEIMRNLYNGKWDLRIGDIEGCTELLNISFTEVLDEIHDRMKEIETNQYLTNSQKFTSNNREVQSNPSDVSLTLCEQKKDL